MDIIPTARESLPNLSRVTTASSSASSSTPHGSSMSVTSNDRTTLMRQMNQVKAEIQQLHDSNGSWAQMQKLETQMSDIQKRLSELTSRKETKGAEKQKAADKAAKTSVSDYTRPNADVKESEKTASLYTFIGMFLDIYA